MRIVNILCLFCFFALVVGATETFARPQEKGSAKCSDGIDNDGDGLVDADDPDCGGTNIDDVARRVRVNFPSIGSIYEDGNGVCMDHSLGDFNYWHSNPSHYDQGCEDIETNTFDEPSQRTQNAILACGFCFNTFGPFRPHDASIWNHVNRWVTFDWSLNNPLLDIDIDQEIYNTDFDPNCSPDHTVLCNTPLQVPGAVDNLEVAFYVPDPFTVIEMTSVPNFEIEIVAPRTHRNGRVVWETRYTLVYPTDVEVFSIGTNLITLSTDGDDGNGDAILTRLSDGFSWNVWMPFSLVARQVFKDADGNCCFEFPPQ